MKKDCPSPEQLFRFQLGQPEVANKGDHAALMAHISTCADCQSTLEATAGEGSRANAMTRAASPSEFGVDTDLTEPPSPRSRYNDSEKLGHQTVDFSGVPDFSADANSNLSAADAPEIVGYQIIRELARGGMGVVWSALDSRLDREVAIKTVLPGMKSESASHRFVREAQIAARLAHPGIPPVHALGTLPDGRPFLVMKLIRGQTLADLLTSRDSTQSELPRFLQIFEQISQAVGFAHRQGIIHRDLKPANVMVGEFGEVQVMDWGLAKFLTESDRESGAQTIEAENFNATLAGTVMGSPAFMAPEQARGESVDTRSDVFSLGAMLCAILTGTAPFGQERSSLEKIRLAATGKLDQVMLRLDRSGADPTLVALAKQCLAPSAEERPVDAVEVATAVATFRAEMERRLRQAAEERVAAEAKAIEQKKRRRILVAATGLIITALALGAAVSTNQAFRAKKAEKETQRQLEKTQTAKNEADAARIQAQRSADTATAINEFILLDILAAPNPYGGQGHEVKMVDALNSAEAALAERFADQPIVEASVRDVLAKSFHGLGEAAKAADQMQRAWEIRRDAIGENDPDTLQSQATLGPYLSQLDQYDRAEEILRDVIPRLEARLGPQNFMTISAKINLGNTLQTLSRFDESDALLKQALTDLEVHYPDRYREALTTISTLAASLNARGDYQNAEEWTRRQVDLAEKTSTPEAYLSGLNTLGVIYINEKRFNEALEIQTRLLRKAKEILPPGHWHLAVIRMGLATSLFELGRETEAIPVIKLAYEGMRDGLGPDNYNTIKSLSSLVEQLQKNKLDEQLDEYREVFMYTWLRTANRDQVDRVETAMNIYLERAREAEGFDEKTFYKQLLDYREQNLSEGHDRRAQFTSNLGSWLLEQGAYEQAEPLLVEALATWKGNAGDVKHVPWQRSQLRRVYEALDRADEAAKYRDKE